MYWIIETEDNIQVCSASDLSSLGKTLINHHLEYYDGIRHIQDYKIIAIENNAEITLNDTDTDKFLSRWDAIYKEELREYQEYGQDEDQHSTYH